MKQARRPAGIGRRGFLSLSTGLFLSGIPWHRALGQDPEPGWVSMDLPYVHQVGGGSCYQACLAMILRHFFPREDFPFPRLDQLTRHRPGDWTFEAQLLPPLLERGLKVELHATTPYAQLTPALAEKRYGRTALNKMDFQALAWAQPYLTADRFFPQALEWKQVLNKFLQGWVTFICVNEDVLIKQNLGVFIGHGLIVTGVSKEAARVHDPARTAAMLYPLQQLEAAFISPGTDRAGLFVKR